MLEKNSSKSYKLCDTVIDWIDTYVGRLWIVDILISIVDSYYVIYCKKCSVKYIKLLSFIYYSMSVAWIFCYSFMFKSRTNMYLVDLSRITAWGLGSKNIRETFRNSQG